MKKFVSLLIIITLVSSLLGSTKQYSAAEIPAIAPNATATAQPATSAQATGTDMLAYYAGLTTKWEAKNLYENITTSYDSFATMGDIATIFVNVQGWKNVTPASNTYSDLILGSAYADNILRLVAKGVLDGKGEINADSPVTREAFFQLFAKMIGTKSVDTNTIYHFKDVSDITEEIRPIFSALYTAGILTGDASGAFRPKENVTINEITDAIDRKFDRELAPAGTNLVGMDEPYLTKNFNRFGNMNPSNEMYINNYLMKEDPFKIIGNVYYVGNTWAASYLVDTGGGLMLLDTPCWPEFWMLLDSIYKLGFDPMDIKYIVCSHAHPDHYGCIKPLIEMNPNIKTFVGEVDAASLVSGMTRTTYDRTYQNQAFIPDVLLKDGDYVELGNTKIKCVLTPGHTKGVMSWFWTVKDHGKKYNIGYYGGAGFSTMATDKLKKIYGMNDQEAVDFQKVFSDSIDKVWDEPCDVMLGNHPFHNDTFEKYERVIAGDKNAFIDPTEWHRFLTELKDCYNAFLKMTPEEVNKMYEKSSMLIFQDKSLSQHQWPFE